MKHKVRTTIEGLPGLPVAAININVIINLPKEEKTEAVTPEEDTEEA